MFDTGNYISVDLRQEILVILSKKITLPKQHIVFCWELYFIQLILNEETSDILPRDGPTSQASPQFVHLMMKV